MTELELKQRSKAEIQAYIAGFGAAIGAAIDIAEHLDSPEKIATRLKEYCDVQCECFVTLVEESKVL